MTHHSIHIHPLAKVGENNHLSPNLVIEEGVEIGNHNQFLTGTVIKKGTIIGDYNTIGEYAIIGGNPQDISFDVASTTGVKIGHHNQIREFATIHRATKENGYTEVGNHNMLMGYTHLAHDTKIHNHVVLVNGSQLAGFAEIQDHAFLSGDVGIHQFVVIGAHVMIAAFSKLTRDVPPFTLVEGLPGKYYGLNVVGLRRSGFTQQEREDMKEFYKIYYKSNNYAENLALLKAKELSPIQQKIMDFFTRDSKRGFITKKKSHHLSFNSESNNNQSS